MGDLVGKIGVNRNWVDQEVHVTKVSKTTFKTKEEALEAAQLNRGSELVYEQDGQWHIGKVGEKGWTFMDSDRMYPLYKADQAEIELDHKKLASHGVASAQISFIDEDKMHPLMQMAKDTNSSVRLELARRPDLPYEVFMELADDNSTRVQAALAQNPATPIDALREIASDGYRFAQKSVALNPNARADAKISASLAESRYSDVRRLMALSPEQLQQATQRFEQYMNNFDQYATYYQLANDPYSDVREKLAVRYDLPNEIFMELANDAYSSVRERVASNPYASIDALRLLASDAYSSVREQVARHPLARQDSYIMNQLANDPYSDVRQALLDPPSYALPYTYDPHVFIDPFGPSVYSQAAVQTTTQTSVQVSTAGTQVQVHNQTTTTAVGHQPPPGNYAAYMELATDSHSSVRGKLATQHDLPNAVFVRLANDSHSSVREKVATNPYASLDALRRLANDSHSSVREIVARHPVARQDSYIMNELANDSHSSVRKALLDRPLFQRAYPVGHVHGGVTGATQVTTQSQSSGVHIGDNINISGNNNTIVIQDSK